MSLITYNYKNVICLTVAKISHKVIYHYDAISQQLLHQSWIFKFYWEAGQQAYLIKQLQCFHLQPLPTQDTVLVDERHHDVIKSKIFKLQRWRRHFWKAHEKLSWVAKVKLYLASAVFELLLLIWAKAQIIPLTQKTVFLLLLLLFFYGFFAGLFLLQFSIYRHENSQECWYYCHLDCYDFLWRWIW